MMNDAEQCIDDGILVAARELVVDDYRTALFACSMLVKLNAACVLQCQTYRICTWLNPMLDLNNVATILPFRRLKTGKVLFERKCRRHILLS